MHNSVAGEFLSQNFPFKSSNCIDKVPMMLSASNAAWQNLQFGLLFPPLSRRCRPGPSAVSRSLGNKRLTGEFSQKKKKKSDKKTWQKPNWLHIFLPGLNNNNSKQQPRKSVSNVSAIKMDYFWNVHDDARSLCKPCSVYEEKRKVWHGRSPTRRDLPPLLGRIISRATRPKQNFLFSGFLGSPRKSIPEREGTVGVRH